MPLRPMAFTGRLFKNRNFILILAIVLGLVIGEPVATKTEPLVLPLLALVMTLSAANITSREFTSFKAMPRTILLSLFLNYIVLGGTILLLAWWLIDDKDLWAGFVVLATVPPAVAVVPFSYVLGGNTLFSLLGMTGAYLAALVIMPAVMALFLSTGLFRPRKIAHYPWGADTDTDCPLQSFAFCRADETYRSLARHHRELEFFSYPFHHRGFEQAGLLRRI